MSQVLLSGTVTSCRVGALPTPFHVYLSSDRATVHNLCVAVTGSAQDVKILQPTLLKRSDCILPDTTYVLRDGSQTYRLKVEWKEKIEGVVTQTAEWSLAGHEKEEEELNSPNKGITVTPLNKVDHYLGILGITLDHFLQGWIFTDPHRLRVVVVNKIYFGFYSF